MATASTSEEDNLERDYIQLRRFFPSTATDPWDGILDTSEAIDWTDCIEKERDLFVSGGSSDLFRATWKRWPQSLGREPCLIVKDIRITAKEYLDEKQKRRKRKVRHYNNYDNGY